MRISNPVATLETAKAEFEASWKQWKACAGLGEGAIGAHGAPRDEPGRFTMDRPGFVGGHLVCVTP
jgi:hypothetical protein